jgi:hypothetical protein
MFIPVALGGLVVSVLATGPQGSRPRAMDGFLRAIKIRSTTSHVVDLRHVKEPSGMNRTSSVRKQNSSSHFSPQVS